MKMIERETDRDNFLGAAEAVKYGLMDKAFLSRAEAGVRCFFADRQGVRLAAESCAI